MKNMKILINVPRGKHGGVANYYAGLNGKFMHDIDYNYIGNRSNTKIFLLYILLDYFIFIFKLIKINPDIIHLNPSLDKKSTIREGLFLIIAKLFRKKVIVFWRGWNLDIEKKISDKYSKIFLRVYGQADSFIVLAKDFKSQLVNWGIKKNIYTETTQITDSLLTKFKIEDKKFDHNKILFMSRIEKKKGIYESIDAIIELNKKNIEFIIAGNGPELENVKNYVSAKKCNNIIFLGYVFGDDKIKILKEATMCIFPTFYGEGMPNSVLESMAFGLPVVTRSVGGLKDFFENGKMGYITESKDPKVFAELIERLINDKEKMKEIGKYNHEYAIRRFLASKVAKRLDEIYEKVYYGK